MTTADEEDEETPRGNVSYSLTQIALEFIRMGATVQVKDDGGRAIVSASLPACMKPEDPGTLAYIAERLEALSDDIAGTSLTPEESSKLQDRLLALVQVARKKSLSSRKSS